MVYCGKPSRGCQMCRTRRIKCDETKPTCNQCAKSRRQCPGYKDEFDLVFRNETKATERRAQKANKKAIAQKTTTKQEPLSPLSPISLSSLPSPSTASTLSSPTSTELKASSSPTELISPAASIGNKSPIEQAVIPSLKIPDDQRASCLFVSNFVLIPPQGGNTVGYMDFVIPLLKQEGPRSHLQHAFNACSLAFMDNRGGKAGNATSEKALGEYSQALAGMKVALQDRKAQQADSTIAAVLLLGLFENITAKQIGMLNWGSHIEGAIQLVKARGRKQLRTKLGLSIFIAVRTQMIIHCLTSGTAPVMGSEWWLNDTVHDQTAAQVQRHMIKTSELRAEIMRIMNTVAKTPENVEIMLELTRKAQTIDQEVLSWMRNVPEHWRYKTVAWEDNVAHGDYSKAEVFPGRVDVYQDFWFASLWNSARTMRLILASVIVRCAAWICSPVDYRTTPEYATAARTAVDTITDIIASVPYHLGWHLDKKHIIQKANLGGFACGEEHNVKGLAGYFLTWPLANVYSQDYTTDAQRAWINGRLKHIGDQLGVQYAHILRQIQVRIPSMLIRHDGLVSAPYGAAQNYTKLMTARAAPPMAGYSMNPLQQREAMQKKHFEQTKAELIAQAAGTSGDDGKWVARKWLTAT